MLRSAFCLAGRLAVFVGCVGCVATPQLAPLTIAPGCYAVNADNWPPVVAAATGLSVLPSFLGLDTTVAGPRGRRVIVPISWEQAAPHSRSAYWTEEPHGDRAPSLVLTFLGPAGDFVASLEASRDGYRGEGVGLNRRGTGRLPQVQVALVAISCGGLKLAPAEPVP